MQTPPEEVNSTTYLFSVVLWTESIFPIDSIFFMFVCNETELCFFVPRLSLKMLDRPKLILKVKSFLTTDNPGFSLNDLIYNAVLFYLIFVTRYCG